MKTFNLMLVLTDRVDLDSWIEFATKLVPIDGEIHLRALVTIEEGKSLSEGTLAAREWRDALNQVVQICPKVNDDIRVQIDYQPFNSVLEEIQLKETDYLLVQWGTLDKQIGGLRIEDVIQSPHCSVILVSGISRIRNAQTVFLSLRGGPNLSIGTQVATAVAGAGSITLFHAVDHFRSTPNLETVMRSVPQITRTITGVTDIVEGIVHESDGHDVIVMGAGFKRVNTLSLGQRDVVQSVFERTKKPIILVRAAQQESLEFHVPHLLNKVEEPLSVRVDRWFAQNTFHSSEFSNLDNLMVLKEKQGTTIGLVLPTLNEEETIANVITTLKTELMDRVPILDEIVVIDSESSDSTVAIAKEFGIPTYIHQQILADEVGSNAGKGEALWKSLYVTKSDIVVWVDTDITNIHPRFIYGLIGPLLKNRNTQYVKGFYTRPIKVGDKLQAYGGGRVTELVARPLLNLFYPELSGIIQPLSGEYAGRRQALELIPFFSGYGVETGLLIDILNQFGLESIVQSDLETRIHHNQPLVNLSKMSFAILQVFIARLESRYGVELLKKANRSMKLVIQEPERFALDIAEIGDYERAPMITIAPYKERYGHEY